MHILNPNTRSLQFIQKTPGMSPIKVISGLAIHISFLIITDYLRLLKRWQYYLFQF